MRDSCAESISSKVGQITGEFGESSAGKLGTFIDLEQLVEMNFQ